MCTRARLVIEKCASLNYVQNDMEKIREVGKIS